MRSWSTESKNFWTSRSNTQSFFQHRSRHFFTAISGERPGRYPYESSWKIDSMRGSNWRATTVWATLSATVGTPSILVPLPCGFGISTARTGGGKYVPEDIRRLIHKINPANPRPVTVPAQRLDLDSDT